MTSRPADAQPGGADRGGRAGIGDEEIGFLLRELGGGGQGDQPGGDQREKAQDVKKVVAPSNHHPSAGGQAQRRQAGGKAAHGEVELLVAQARLDRAVGQDQRRFFGAAGGVVREAEAGEIEGHGGKQSDLHRSVTRFS